MHELQIMEFELQGQFAGFVRTAKGKRRMLLRVGAQEYLLKIAKRLRSSLTAGDTVWVFGDLKTAPRSGREKRKVLALRVLNSLPQPVSPKPAKIRVCNKSNCWQAGGRELWERLARRAAESGVAVELKGVRCLGNCKRAPNMTCQGCFFERCKPADADALIAKLKAAAAH